MSEYKVEERLRDLELWMIRGLAFLVAFSLSVCVGAALYAIHERGTLNDRLAEQSEVISCFVRDQFDRSEKGLPSNPYYREHQNELAAALDSIAQQRVQAIKAFGACTAKRQGGTP